MAAAQLNTIESTRFDLEIQNEGVGAGETFPKRRLYRRCFRKIKALGANFDNFVPDAFSCDSKRYYR